MVSMFRGCGECDVEVDDNLEVSLNGDVQSVVFEVFRDVLSNSVGLWSRGVLEYGKSVVSVQSNAFLSVGVT